MATIGIIGAGEVGSQIARAAIANGYDVVIANSRGPETLRNLIAELGPSARAATATTAAAAADFAVIAVPLKVVNDMPAEELAQWPRSARMACARTPDPRRTDHQPRPCATDRHGIAPRALLCLLPSCRRAL
ncbi:NAD(P)-binding domain-containing protein [Nocardia jinanensis]|uniref:NAD(P)-binding domain-containing protein n=1 Tax=Nocardia jinanensis TaxID=382504 RepID=UPI000A40E023|nr:NAD(P)-binding domain-containing protein [Nocardia jinanensis]